MSFFKISNKSIEFKFVGPRAPTPDTLAIVYMALLLDIEALLWVVSHG